MTFKNRTVLVAGGARGIGSTIAEKFAHLEANVIICDTNYTQSSVNQYQSQHISGFDAAQDLAQKLTLQGAKVTAFEANVCEPEEIDKLLKHIKSNTGRLDVVVNAFGVTHVSKVEDMTLEEFNAIINVNLTGVFIVSKAAIPYMRKNGGGAIINISSISGRRGFATVAHYCAAKYGVIGFTSSLAQEVAEDGICVNAVCPGIVRTNMWHYLLDKFKQPNETREECWQRMLKMIPQKTAQTPEDIADMVVFLGSARRITGQAFSVDGGWNLTP